jgi:hypothetical protein
MEEIKEDDRQLILNNHKYFKEQDLLYWHSKLSKRIDFLRPLILELGLKGIKLFEICKPLNQEVFEIRVLLELLEMYKLNK